MLPLAACERVQKDACKGGARARLFVLEVHEHVLAGRGSCLHGLCPALEIARRVTLVSQPEIGIVRGDLDRRRQLLALRHAKRNALGLEQAVYGILEPRCVPELERRPRDRRQPIEKSAEQSQVLLEVRRQLKEENAELGAERVGGLDEVLQQLLAVLEP